MAGGYGSFFPVTAPMVVPREETGSMFSPPIPELAELPEIIDARTTGLRLQGTAAKALPGMADVGSMTNVREMEAMEFARDIGLAFSESKAYENRSQAIAKAKNRRAQAIAERGSKGSGKSGVKRSQYNERREGNSKIRGAQNLTGPNAFPYLFAIR